MSDIFQSHIEGRIEADEVHIGLGVRVEPGVVIRGKGGPAKRVYLGDFSYIGQGTKIFAPEFILGDYTKLNERTFGHGVNPLRIGRNCWFGGNVVLDSMGGLDIDDNVGIGAGSQLWTHVQFGDIVEGSRFFSSRYMHIGKDAWFVGHCLVSPVKVEPRAMALLGSVVTSDMLENRIYGGSPAKDLSEKVGYQFESRTVEQKAAVLNRLISEFGASQPALAEQLRCVTAYPEQPETGVTYFNVSDRTYLRQNSEAEVVFLKTYVPLVKFAPSGAPALYSPLPPSD